MFSTILRNIGERIGRVIEVDTREDGNCPGKFGRIRVMLDITNPLRQGVWIRQEKSEEDLCIILLHERILSSVMFVDA